MNRCCSEQLAAVDSDDAVAPATLDVARMIDFDSARRLVAQTYGSAVEIDCTDPLHRGWTIVVRKAYSMESNCSMRWTMQVLESVVVLLDCDRWDRHRADRVDRRLRAKLLLVLCEHWRRHVPAY